MHGVVLVYNQSDTMFCSKKLEKKRVEDLATRQPCVEGDMKNKVQRVVMVHSKSATMFDYKKFEKNKSWREILPDSSGNLTM